MQLPLILLTGQVQTTNKTTTTPQNVTKATTIPAVVHNSTTPPMKTVTNSTTKPMNVTSEGTAATSKTAAASATGTGMHWACMSRQILTASVKVVLPSCCVIGNFLS